jgi:hypothetical protein
LCNKAILNYAFAAAGLLPAADEVRTIVDREFFTLDYTFWLNVVFGVLSLGCLVWKIARSGWRFALEAGAVERGLFVAAIAAYGWLIAGLLVAA